MKTLTILHQNFCPYCRMARRAVQELQAEDARFAAVPVRWIEENAQRAEAAPYTDYWYVPSLYLEGEKLYEASPRDGYEDIRAQVRRGLELAYNENKE